MIRVRQIKILCDDFSENNLKNKIANLLKINNSDILKVMIHKKSIDARKKPQIFYVIEADVLVKNEGIIQLNENIFKSPNEEYTFKITGSEDLNYRPIIVGSGPAGLFCAYVLAENGYKPIVIERGSNIEKRTIAVEHFWQTGEIDINTNVQFGEGGAGTFSDGKLNTLNKDEGNRQRKVFNTFVQNGAHEDILYDSKPHVGTDVLKKVIPNIREKIIAMGGEFYFNSLMTDIEVVNGKIKRIEINNEYWLDTDVLVLAIGHSARDTMEMLYRHKLGMIPKPFAMGVRVEHLQKDINISQYGSDNPNLPPASYKLTYTTKKGKGVYTFCMCPGGYVVNASSERDHLVVNGMSNYGRESENANSAIVVTVNEDDYGHNVMDGMKLQRQLEEKAYLVGNGKITIQRYKDFCDDVKTTSVGKIKPIVKGDYILGNLNEILPKYISDAIKEAMPMFSHKIKCFADDDVLFLGLEARTSSPIRINRDEDGVSDILGVYPCGEGAGYAGGITTSAIDGIKVAENIEKKYRNF